MQKSCQKSKACQADDTLQQGVRKDITGITTDHLQAIRGRMLHIFYFKETLMV